MSLCCGNPCYHHHHRYTTTAPLFSPWEHTGTQMVKPTLVMSGKGGRWVGGGCCRWHRGHRQSAYMHTHKHLHRGIEAGRGRGPLEGERGTRRWTNVQMKVIGGPWTRCVLCTCRGWRGSSVVHKALASRWHLCPRCATLRGTVRPARGTWQHSACMPLTSSLL